MTNKIILKKSAVPGRVPEANSLVYGELAINYADEKIYFKNTANQIVPVTQPIPTFDINLTGDVSGTGTYNGGNVNITTSIDPTQPINTGAVTIEETLTIDTTSTVTQFSGQEYLIDEFSLTTFRTAKYLVQITSNSHVQSSELMVVHNGTEAFMTEYAFVQSNGPLATLDVKIELGYVQLVALTNYTDLRFKVVRNAIKA